MTETRKKILMACCNYWYSPFQVGSHQLAKGFARAGWDVAFISDPISPLHILNGATGELRERFALYSAGGAAEIAGNLWAYVPGALVTPHNKPVLRSEWVHRKWHKLTCPNVVKMAKQHDFGQVDLLYFDSVSQLFWLQEISFKKSVFRIADKNTGFFKFTPGMAKMQNELAQKVDAVVYSAQNLQDHVLEMQPKETFYLPNGVDFQHFAEGPTVLPAELAGIPKPIALYVGAMDIWFDFDLVSETARRLPNMSFVLIGPDRLAKARLQHLPNVFVLGSKPYDEIPAYLYNADVGIIPFDVSSHSELVNSIHPLKLYEYMACGLPTVAVEWDELKRMETPAVLCSTVEQFISGIKETLAATPDREKLVSYARSRDWNYRVAQLVQKLDL